MNALCTPGPWKAFELDDGASLVHWGPIAYFRTGGGLDHKVQVANATLAAAAPEMAETLRAILDSEDTTLGDGGSILGNDLRTMAVAVLAKLEGGQP